MTPEDRFHRRLNYFVLGWLLGVAILGLSGCASLWQSTKSAAAPAGGAAAGALAGSLAGPAGTVIGAAAGAVVGDSIEENASLRSGETVGEGALDNEIARWKGRARAASATATAAQEASDWFYALLKWGAAAFAAWFLFRNRHNIRDLGIYNGIIHSIFGGGAGKAITK